MEPDSFTHRHVARLGKRLYRLGLSASYGLDERAAREALDGPFQAVFWNPTARVLTGPLRDACRRDRDRYAVASGPTLGYLAGSVRRSVERSLRLLGTDHLDVLQVYWVGRMSALTAGVLEEMVRLRESGNVRAIGVSLPDRPSAARPAGDSPVELPAGGPRVGHARPRRRLRVAGHRRGQGPAPPGRPGHRGPVGRGAGRGAPPPGDRAAGPGPGRAGRGGAAPVRLRGRRRLPVRPRRRPGSLPPGLRRGHRHAARRRRPDRSEGPGLHRVDRPVRP